ncbi:hypothetical protein DRO69_06715 [Candidatus Bathyarchaeota archaeon]|nr:MAG: hypothetical protein DRO69_06715 [Candidatus Bathyarchaeota archaeon]
MLVCKKVAILFVFMLVFSTLNVVGIAGSQTESGLPADMPVVYVDPQLIIASPGETFTVSVKVFNLTDTLYAAAEPWEPGEPLPPPGTRYCYYLGNLYGLHIQLSWDPLILEYVSHTVKIPVETYPDGVLHEPIQDVMEEVDADAGTYTLSKASMPPAEAFICPEANATIFTITFNVTKEGKCTLQLDDVELSTSLEPNIMDKIPHWVLPGEFQSTGAMTRIASVNIGALAAGKLYHPIIIGENATVLIGVINDGNVQDTYNLTLYNGTISLRTWENEALEPGESKTFNYTIKAEDLDRGLHSITVNATIIHEGKLFIDAEFKEFRVIDTPTLSISEPPSVIKGDTVTLSASGSVHNDPDGEILNYTWSLIEPGAGTSVFKTYEGISMTHTFAKNGTWRIILTVKDNWGVTYNPDRPATEPYQKEILLNVGAKSETPFTIENIAFVIIIAVVLILIVVYLRRRAR